MIKLNQNRSRNYVTKYFIWLEYSNVLKSNMQFNWFKDFLDYWLHIKQEYKPIYVEDLILNCCPRAFAHNITCHAGLMWMMGWMTWCMHGGELHDCCEEWWENDTNLLSMISLHDSFVGSTLVIIIHGMLHCWAVYGWYYSYVQMHSTHSTLELFPAAY